MLTIYDWQRLSLKEQQQCLQRPVLRNDVKSQVQAIIQSVQNEGDKALLDLSRAFDGLDLKTLRLPLENIMSAEIEPRAMAAITQAIQNLRIYHEAIMPSTKRIMTAKGILIDRIYRPISRVGLYVPGGNNTPLISSVLMQAIPAQIAGCPIKVLCTPPNAAGHINPHLLVAARLCGIDTIYPIGGAQAIAAMAYGTETVMKVDKLFGPGNAYVTEAKTQVSIDPKGAAIDMPAGPSEVMVFADNRAIPAIVAADLLAQAEHGIDSQVLLICESEDFATRVNQAMKEQFQNLSRQDILSKALQNSRALVSNDRSAQLKIINDYAPEHLIINREDHETWVAEINSASTLFLGQWAAETLGDYVTGSNHVLPTNGFARNHSGLSTCDFLKAISVQSVSAEGFKNLAESAQILASLEGLDAHANAIKQRLNLGGS